MVKITSADEGCISIGPWGGQGGEPWSYKADGRITQIILRHGGAIDSILFQSQSCGCLTPERSDKFGGPGGRTDKICIDSSGEHLKTMSLTYGDFQGQRAVRSISFHTNLTEYGPYGKKEGTGVSIPIEGGVVVGFHGRAGRLINAIGVYVAPKIKSFCTENLLTQVETMMMTSSMKLVVPRDPGPWGALGGKPWDDGVFPAIKEVFLKVNAEDSFVLALQFEYEKEDGKCFRSPWHGCSAGSASYMIKLDYPNEVIVGIEGFYGPIIESKSGFEALTSITFYTNKQKYGPYGDEIGTHFSSMQNSGGKVVGFFGRSSIYLNAIGVHMQYV